MTLEDEIIDIREKIVELEKRIIRLKNSSRNIKTKSDKKKLSISGRLAQLKTQGFFDQPKLTNEIVDKLATGGFHYPHQSLTWPLQNAVRKGELGRIKKQGKWAYCKR